MGIRFLKVVILAAVADGEIQDQELELINSMKRFHPMLKGISDEDVEHSGHNCKSSGAYHCRKNRSR